jgi:hypothetical protein
MTTAKKNVFTMKNGPPFWKTSLNQLIGALPPRAGGCPFAVLAVVVATRSS